MGLFLPPHTHPSPLPIISIKKDFVRNMESYMYSPIRTCLCARMRFPPTYMYLHFLHQSVMMGGGHKGCWFIAHIYDHCGVSTFLYDSLSELNRDLLTMLVYLPVVCSRPIQIVLIFIQ